MRQWHSSYEVQIRRTLLLPPWYELDPFYRGEEIVPDMRGAFYWNVIFLDIDGVLNDEGERYAEGVIIDPEFVENLKNLVTGSEAEIILTSSWRRAVWDYEKYGRTNKELELLISLLRKNDLEIAGIVPMSQASGSRAT